MIAGETVATADMTNGGTKGRAPSVAPAARLSRDVLPAVSESAGRSGDGAGLLTALSRVLLAVVAGLVFWTLVPQGLGWRAEVVLSGSMAPRIRPGDVVLSSSIRPGAVRRGEVVVFRNPAVSGRRLLVHRIAGVNAAGEFITKGDANLVADSTPVPAAAIVGVPRLRVPYIGLPLLWLHDGASAPLLAFTVLLAAVVSSAASSRGSEERF